MKLIILAGGFGTRISEETSDKPKPLVLIDDKPILWHLMSIYAAQGFSDFVIAAGYKSEAVIEWVRSGLDRPWNVQAIDTGLETQTAGRIRRCMEIIGKQRVMVAYGDGLGNVNLNELVAFHLSHKKLATVTAVRPPARFGVIESVDGMVTHFGEKNQADAGWINGGFFVLEPEVLEYIEADSEPFEKYPLPRLVESQQLMAYFHLGFWQPMDTLREKNLLSELANLEKPPWLELG
jgi:glucose-1-phosphate cytidylyltransferase